MKRHSKLANYELSVIVPIYNVEQYLSACIESMLKQEGDIEIILIDDGSTDSSFKIAKKYFYSTSLHNNSRSQILENSYNHHISYARLIQIFRKRFV